MNLVEELTEKFGLSKNEATVYGTLLTLENARASEITRLCNVPRTKLYEITKSLHKKGFIEIIPDRIIKFRAVPFEQAFETFIDEKEKNLAELKVTKEKIKKYIIKDFFAVSKKREESGGGFMLYRSKKVINKKFREMLNQAKHSMFLIVDSSELNHLSYMLPSLKKKKISMKILTPIKKENVDIVKKWLRMYQLRDFTEMTLQVVINEEEILVFQTEEPIALYSKDTRFISLIRNFCQISWGLSVNAEERIKEIVTGKPREQIKFVRGRENYYIYFMEMIRNTKEDLIIITAPMGLIRIYKNVLHLFKEKLRQGIRVRCVIPINEQNLAVAKKMSKMIELRHIDKVHVALVCADTSMASMGYVKSDVPTLRSEKDLDILTNDRSTVDLVREMSESIWEQGISAAARINEIETGRPAEETKIERGRENWYKEFPKMLQNARSDVMFLIPENAIVRLSKYAPDLFENAWKRGIKFRFMLPITRKNLEAVISMSKYLDIRHIDRVYMALTCFDENYVTMAQVTDESLKFESGEEIIYTNNTGTVKMIKKMLEDTWNFSTKKFRERIAELETGEKTEEIKIIRGKKETYDAYLELNKRVQCEVCWIGTEKSIERAKKYGIAAVNQQNAKRGVIMKAILPIVPENVKDVKELMKIADIRHIGFSPPIRMAMYDRSECLIRHGGEKSYELSKNFSIYSNAKDFVASMMNHFERMWEQATPAKDVIKNIENSAK